AGRAAEPEHALNLPRGPKLGDQRGGAPGGGGDRLAPVAPLADRARRRARAAEDLLPGDVRLEAGRPERPGIDDERLQTPRAEHVAHEGDFTPLRVERPHDDDGHKSPRPPARSV